MASHPARVLDLASTSIDVVKELAHLTALPPDPPTCLRGPLQVRKSAMKVVVAPERHCRAWAAP